MNAAALLKSQGWRGKGHTLHATDNSIGLANPLLLSRNTDGKGLGANKTFTDQWWLAAFDEKLKGLDVTKNGVVQTVTTGALNAVRGGGGKYSGLYASFVRGGLMEGTLEDRMVGREESTDATPVSEDTESVPGLRKGVVKGKESREERRRRKEAKVERKEAREAAREEKRRRKEMKAVKASKTEETKEERRARRIQRRARKEARRKRREEQEAWKAAKG
jgi:nucleolar protein TMA23